LRAKWGPNRFYRVILTMTRREIWNTMFERPPLSSSKCGEADDVPKQDARFPSLCLIRLQGCLGKLCDRRRNGSGAPATAPTIVAWHKSKNGMIRPIYSILTRRQVRMSPNHCSRLFKESTGQSPHRYVVEARVRRAKELLTTGKLTTGEVAYYVGFADQSHFTLHFKRIFGLSPKRLLKRRRPEIVV